MRERYERAVVAQRADYHDADLARRNADTLSREAFLAAERATRLNRCLPAGQPAHGDAHQHLAFPVAA